MSTVSIGRTSKDRNDIRLRWRVNKKRYSLCLGKSSPKLNALAKIKAAQIELDISSGVFDTTLNKYRYDESTTEKPLDIVGMFGYWAKNIRGIDKLESSYYLSTLRMLQSWGKPTPDKIPELLQKQNYSASTYNHRLSHLKLFLKWMVKNRFVPVNPLEDISYKKNPKGHTLKDTPRDPLTIEEITKILDAVRTNKYCSKYSAYKHSHYYPFLYFMFSTGVRNAEAVGLRVKHLNFLLGNIEIKEVMARKSGGLTHASARIRKETKTNNIRYLPLTTNLRDVLIPMVDNKEQDDLVFTSPKGNVIDDRAVQKRVFKPVLKELKIRDRDLYCARHSFGTRAIQQHIDIAQVATLMGHVNTRVTIERYVKRAVTLADMPTLFPEIE